MAQGTSDIINHALKITDSGSAATQGATGTVDRTKSMNIEYKINKDSGTAGVGIITECLNKGSSQQATSSDIVWWIRKWGSETQKGGILVKTDGSVFAGSSPGTAGNIPAAATLYANCIAFCSDGAYMCKGDGSSWVVVGSYALT